MMKRGQRVRMAAEVMSEASLLDFLDLRQYDKKKGADYLAWVSQSVSTSENKSFLLKNPAGATLRIAGLGDTIYKDADDEVNAWGKFYLPKIAHMQVIGVVEGTSCPCDQLILMTCEDKKLYAYDGEELHLVASSWKQLCDKGIEYPACKSYFNGEAFQYMTEDDWAGVRKGDVGRRLDHEHQKLVQGNTSAFLKCLKSSGHT
ncbi:uncharacterized protein [Thunnus thynnus]|uniref:uncharacterized protein isoform X1 n=2 Tax=Thunnus thynnus TaxID=8237 RepID=UPI0035277E8E